jgi:tRNA A-37 threonylcarbamoyl transferase component Bud32
LFSPGQRLGRYELLQRLAVGGMAEVYLAFSVGPGDFRKVVAIKRLLPQHALDPQLLRMFLDEARLMARLSHPHIPQVTDVDDGAAGTVPFFVMEYVHGTDLRGVLNAAGGPLPFEHALAITSAVAAGLHHAHEHRGGSGQSLEIVHRDVSPSNILMSFDGGVKVTDFGVAKWTEQKSFTHQGQLKGKFAHMSPEQCRGEALDRRSDVFALGTLLYEMTTGQPPFAAESAYELLKQIVSRDASPPRRPGGEYPAPLEAIVMKSLRRDRDDRYPTTQQLQLDLEAFAREHRLVVSPVALAGYLETLFGAQVTEWREAQASGRTLADHLGTGPVAVRPDPAIPERTATDTFAVKTTLDLTSPGSYVAALTPMGTATAPGAGRNRTTRTVVIAAASVAILASLLVATELTSRWQRASPAPTAAVGTGVGFKNTGVTVLSDRPVGEGPSPIDRGTPPRGTPGPVSAAPAPAPIPAARTVKAQGSGARRGRGGAGRVARRELVTADPSSPGAEEIPGTRTVRAQVLVQGPAPAPGLAPQSRATPQPSAATGRALDAAQPTLLKVWDPDSPVPP